MEQVMDMSDFPWCVGEDGIVIREHPITYDMNGHGSPNPNNRKTFTDEDMVFEDEMFVGLRDYSPLSPLPDEEWEFTGWSVFIQSSGYPQENYTSGITYTANWNHVYSDLSLTFARYAPESGLPNWEGNISGEIKGGNSIPTTQIPNVSQAVEIHLGTNVTKIGKSAFWGCDKLGKITVPDSVSEIDQSAFHNCSNCEIFDFRKLSAMPSLADVSAFQGTSTAKKIMVPDELYDEWIAANNWSSTDNGIIYGIIKASRYSDGVFHYQVTFDANGGNGGWTRIMPYGAEITAPKVTRDGYVFIGWELSPDQTVQDYDATYTAKWVSAEDELPLQVYSDRKTKVVYSQESGLPDVLLDITSL